MKRIISLILVVLLAFAGVTSLAEDDVTGTWYATEVSYGGFALDPSAIGFDMSFVLGEDGSFSVTFNEQSATGTWTMEGSTVTATATGDPLVLTIDGTTLSADIDGVGVVFSREKASSEERVTVYAEDIAAFDGTWIPTEFGISGYYVTADMLSTFGIDASTFEALSFTISGGIVTADGEDVVFQLVDGLLFCEIEGIEGSFRIQLLEGDMIMIDMPTLPVTLVCARAAAAADDATDLEAAA